MMNDSGYFDTHTGQPVTDDELEERYRDMLEQVYGDAIVCGMTFDAARAFKELDPIAYRVGMSEWIDVELGETLTDDAAHAAELRGEDDDDEDVTV